MQDSINKLYEKLVEYEVAEPMLDYIDELDDLIEEEEYDKMLFKQYQFQERV